MLDNKYISIEQNNEPKWNYSKICTVGQKWSKIDQNVIQHA